MNDEVKEEKIEAGETKKTNFIDSTYVIHEMIDELDAANANVKIVITQQEHLIRLVKKDKPSEEILKGFVQNVSEQNETLKSKININEYRKACLNNLLVVAQNSVEVRFAVSMLLEGLGIVNKEAVPFEQRPELKVEEETPVDDKKDA